MSSILVYLKRTRLLVLIVLCLAALTASFAYADGLQRPLAVQIIGDPDAAVTGKFAVGMASPGGKSLTVAGVIDFMGAGTGHNFFTQGPDNNMQIRSNVDEANTVYDATRSQWNMVMGSASDMFSIKRSPAGSMYDEDALFFIDGTTGNVGIAKVDTGNTSVIPFTHEARLHIKDETSQPTLRIDGTLGTNLFEAYNNGAGAAVDLVARLERATGNFYIDGGYYGQSYNSGSGADVAERIQSSEALEPGDVVEIDPHRAGYFRKTRDAASKRVVGVISTSPGLTLNNEFNESTQEWDDQRPLLALAGRVFVKATVMNGAIEVGDLLVSSLVPGHAMKCTTYDECIGAVIGKALEPLAEGADLIEIQVMLR